MITREEKDLQLKKLQEEWYARQKMAQGGKPVTQFFDEETNRSLLNRLSESSPSDTIMLTRDSDAKLMELWTESAKKYKWISKEGGAIPSDLFFSKQVPLTDCKFVFDETKEGDGVASFRVAIFHNYTDIVDVMPDIARPVVVGAVIADNSPIICPIYITRGCDFVLSGDVGYKKHLTPEHRELIQKAGAIFEEQGLSSSVLGTWYGTQIALLHPLIKEVFSNPKTGIIKPDGADEPRSTKKRKPKVKYVKVHKIDETELDRKIYGEPKEGDGERQFTRKALSWYNIGHWRHYENGKKTFVQGHWKGILRKSQKPMPDERERVIAQVEEVPGLTEKPADATNDPLI